MWDDTIIAVSTPLGQGGLGIVRLSGSRAVAIARCFFRPRRSYSRLPARRPLLGVLLDPDSGEAFEEALVTYFPRPRSYTTEDVVEISCHGSPVLLEEVIRLGIASGARHAHPGEFTLRAFLGGRIDMLQAEAVNDLIRASSLTQAKISYRQMQGRLSSRIARFRRRIIELLAQIEARIEFPEEELGIPREDIARSLRRSREMVARLVKSYDLGRTLRNGLTLAIAGRTNVGKSTLFNTLLDRERAIVSPIAGTTRDYLTESCSIGDARFTLVDMAGMGSSAQPIEREGIRRGIRQSDQADGILLMLDSSRPESDEDLALVKRYASRKTLLIWNKIDLPSRLDGNRIRKLAPQCPHMEISALKGTNMDLLKDKIRTVYVPEHRRGDEVILQLRQKLCLEEIHGLLSSALEILEQNASEETVAEEIRGALPLIGRLTGEIRSDEILRTLFGRFCIGK
jgi:tRNA modification GTPase